MQAVLKLGFSFAQRINGYLTRGCDLILAFAVILILGMMIVPLPTVLIDVLIAVNITIAAVILLAALYISDAAKFPSFPTLLLLTTLFRLAINVSSTRLILLQADAGEIILAFGEFVVRGNYAVGAVVFLVLVVIQFIVIAKGAERVAEVAARFTLDAMPGKQMSIDADLRAGAIQQEDAAQRRKQLENESQFYGAMEGAMKFVKGDAIAGIIIVLINVCGGIAVGATQMGMSASEAAGQFTLLTIGDGLVSQIPALLISVAAGLVVTRVAQTGESDGRGVAREMLQQMIQQPRALLCVSAFLTGLAFLPGFPMFVFLPLAAMLALVAWPGLSQDAADGASSGAQSKSGADRDGHALAPHPQPLCIRVHPLLAPELYPDSDVNSNTQSIEARLRETLEILSGEMGVLFPAPDVEYSTTLPPCGYEFRVFDCPVSRGVLYPSQCVALCSSESAEAAGLSADPIALAWTRAPACLLEDAETARAKAQKIVTLAPIEVMLRDVEAVLRRHAHEFIGVQETRKLLSNLEERYPALVQEVVTARLSVQQVAEVLQLLVREQVSIRDMRSVVESLARWSAKIKEPSELVECVRRDVGRSLSYRLAPNGYDLFVYRLDDGFERELQESVRPTPSGPVFAPTPDLRDRLVKSIGACVRFEDHPQTQPVLLTFGALRRQIRAMLEIDYPEVAVVSTAELPSWLQVRSIGRISSVPPAGN